MFFLLLLPLGKLLLPLFAFVVFSYFRYKKKGEGLAELLWKFYFRPIAGRFSFVFSHPVSAALSFRMKPLPISTPQMQTLYHRVCSLFSAAEAELLSLCVPDGSLLFLLISAYLLSISADRNARSRPWTSRRRGGVYRAANTAGKSLQTVGIY